MSPTAAGDAGPPPPRVLVIEDDPSIRRFIQLALEDEPIELLEADTVNRALARLRQDGPFRLVFTDLMLPDGSGIDVLQAMAADPGLRRGAQVVVFSAGLTTESRQRLEALGVDAVLAKPAGVADLLRATHRALQAAPASGAAQADATAQAVDRYFAGNRALFDAFRGSCVAQFVHDRRSGDAAVAAADWPALRRLAHSLKSVLQTLGLDAASAVARQLETDAALGHPDAARDGWARLGAELDAVTG